MILKILACSRMIITAKSLRLYMYIYSVRSSETRLSLNWLSFRASQALWLFNLHSSCSVMTTDKVLCHLKLGYPLMMISKGYAISSWVPHFIHEIIQSVGLPIHTQTPTWTVSPRTILIIISISGPECLILSLSFICVFSTLKNMCVV